MVMSQHTGRRVYGVVDRASQGASRFASLPCGSWDAFEKVEPFTEAVRKQLSIRKAQRGVRALPKSPLPEETFDKIDHVHLVRLLLRHAVADGVPSGRPAIQHGVFLLHALAAARAVEGADARLAAKLAAGPACGNNPKPSVVVVDSRSCRSAPTCGIDGGRKVKGVKINLVVDKHGFPLAVNISKANIHDTVSIVPALREASADGFRESSHAASADCKPRKSAPDPCKQVLNQNLLEAHVLVQCRFISAKAK
jgi:hypothetical protein